MDIKRVNTSKGLVIRYVFEDEAEYQTYMEYLSSIERCFDEENKENEKEKYKKDKSEYEYT